MPKQYGIPMGTFLKPLNRRELDSLLAKNPVHSSSINKELEKTVTTWFFTEDDILSRRWDEGLWIVRLPYPVATGIDTTVAFSVMVQNIVVEKE